jgi:hypothetical protein
MAKVVLSGWFHEVGEPEQKGEKKDFAVQKVVLLVPGYENRLKDIKRPDEPWLMQVKGENVKKLNLTQADVNKRVTVTAFVEGFAMEATKDRPAFMGYQVTLFEVEPIK